MNNKNTIVILLNSLLVISVIGELIALYTGKFVNNQIPFVTYFYNIMLIGIIALYSIEPKKRKQTMYLPTRTKIKEIISNEAEKYYISMKKDLNNVPDTKEIWINPSTKEKYYNTCDFDDKTIEYIKQQRYKSAAQYLNSLQENKKDVQ